MTFRNCLVSGVAIVAVAVSACSRQGPADDRSAKSSDVVEVEVVPVGRSEIHSSLEVVGTLFPWKFAMVASEVDGIIQDIPDSGQKVEYEVNGEKHTESLFLDLGHRVKKGDVLVQIDPTEYQLALKAAEARLQLAQKELENLRAWKRPEEVDQLRAAFEEASAVYDEAEAEWKRVQQLRPNDVLSQSEFDQAERALHVARALKARAEAGLKVAEAGPTVEQLAVAEAQVAAAKAEVALRVDKLAKCTIRCPLEKGVIVERFFSEGDRVTAAPKTEIMRIIDPSILLAEVAVPERYQGRIRRGSMATVRGEGVAGGHSAQAGVPAMVVLVNEQIDPATRTFRLRVGLDNHQGIFKAGTFVKVELPLESASEALVAPRQAVTFAEGEPAVFVCRDGRVDRRPVQLGISSRTHYEVLSGLAEGEQVVVGNTSLLADGLRVRASTASADRNGGPPRVRSSS